MTGQELLGHGQQGAGGDLGPAVGPGPGVLLLDGLADRRDAAAEELLGHRELLGLEGGQGGVAVGGRGGQPAGLSRPPGLPCRRAGPGRSAGGGRRRSRRADSAAGFACRSSPTAVAVVPRGLAVAADRCDRARGRTGRRAPSRDRRVASSRRRLDLEARTTLTSGPRWGVPRTSILSPGGSRLALRGEQGGHRGAVQGGLDLGPEHRAHAGPLRDQRGVDRPTRLLGPGGTPRPGGVPGLAGEFDFDAMGHTGRQATAVTARPGKTVPDARSKKGLRTP